MRRQVTQLNVVNNKAIRFLLLMQLAAVPAMGFPQEEAGAVLNKLENALGAAKLKTLRYAGSGSSYVVGEGPVPPGGWPHSVMKSYVRDLDLQRMTSRMELVRTTGTPPEHQTVRRVVDADSPWSAQYEFWITPYGFLKGAQTYNAKVEPKTVYGVAYRAVTFTAPGNHRVVGYINDKDLIEKVETWIGDNADVLVEVYYRDYTDFGGLKVPTMITEKQAGALTLILIVKDVRAETN